MAMSWSIIVPFPSVGTDNTGIISPHTSQRRRPEYSCAHPHGRDGDHASSRAGLGRPQRHLPGEARIGVPTERYFLPSFFFIREEASSEVGESGLSDHTGSPIAN